MNFKGILKKNKAPFILPIMAIIFEIIVLTLANSRLIWEIEDYHFTSPIFYTGPYNGEAIIELSERPTDKYLFIFKLYSAASSYSYFYLDLNIINLDNSDTYNYSLSIKGILDSKILDISPGQYNLFWETNAHMSKLSLHALGFLNQEGDPNFTAEIMINILGIVLIFSCSIIAIKTFFIKERFRRTTQSEKQIESVGEPICPICGTDIKYLAICPKCGHVVKVK